MFRFDPVTLAFPFLVALNVPVLLILGRESRNTRWFSVAFLLLLILTVTNYSYQILSIAGIVYGIVSAAIFLTCRYYADRVYFLIGPSLIAVPITTVVYSASRLLFGLSISHIWDDFDTGALAVATTLGLWAIGSRICVSGALLSRRTLFIVIWAISILWIPMWAWVAPVLGNEEYSTLQFVTVTVVPMTLLVGIGLWLWALLSRWGFSSNAAVVAFSALAPMQLAGGLGPSGLIALCCAVVLAYRFTRRRGSELHIVEIAIPFPLVVILFWIAISTLDAVYRPIGVATELFVPTLANALIYAIAVFTARK